MPDKNGWIKTSERMPTEADANEFGDVWWWLPRFASHGPQRDSWNEGEGATHWNPSTDGYEDDNERPAPPEN